MSNLFRRQGASFNVHDSVKSPLSGHQHSQSIAPVIPPRPTYKVSNAGINGNSSGANDESNPRSRSAADSTTVPANLLSQPVHPHFTAVHRPSAILGRKSLMIHTNNPLMSEMDTDDSPTILSPKTQLNHELLSKLFPAIDSVIHSLSLIPANEPQLAANNTNNHQSQLMPELLYQSAMQFRELLNVYASQSLQSASNTKSTNMSDVALESLLVRSNSVQTALSSFSHTSQYKIKGQLELQADSSRGAWDSYQCWIHLNTLYIGSKRRSVDLRALISVKELHTVHHSEFQITIDQAQSGSMSISTTHTRGQSVIPAALNLTKRLNYHFRADSDLERQRWLSILKFYEKQNKINNVIQSMPIREKVQFYYKGIYKPYQPENPNQNRAKSDEFIFALNESAGTDTSTNNNITTMGLIEKFNVVWPQTLRRDKPRILEIDLNPNNSRILIFKPVSTSNTNTNSSAAAEPQMVFYRKDFIDYKLNSDSFEIELCFFSSDSSTNNPMSNTMTGGPILGITSGGSNTNNLTRIARKYQFPNQNQFSRFIDLLLLFQHAQQGNQFKLANADLLFTLRHYGKSMQHNTNNTANKPTIPSDDPFHALFQSMLASAPNNYHCLDMMSQSESILQAHYDPSTRTNRNPTQCDLDRLRILVRKLYAIDILADIRYISCTCGSANNNNSPNSCLILFYQSFLHSGGFEDLVRYTTIHYTHNTSIDLTLYESSLSELRQYAIRGIWQCYSVKHLMNKCKTKLASNDEQGDAANTNSHAVNDASDPNNSFNRYPFSYYLNAMGSAGVELDRGLMNCLFEILIGEIHCDQPSNSANNNNNNINHHAAGFTVQVLSKVIKEPNLVPVIFQLLNYSSLAAIQLAIQNFILLINDNNSTNTAAFFQQSNWQQLFIPLLLDLAQLDKTAVQNNSLESPGSPSSPVSNNNSKEKDSQLTSNNNNNNSTSLECSIFTLLMSLLTTLHYYTFLNPIKKPKLKYLPVYHTLCELSEYADLTTISTGAYRILLICLLNMFKSRAQHYTDNYDYSDRTAHRYDNFFLFMDLIEEFILFRGVRAVKGYAAYYSSLNANTASGLSNTLNLTSTTNNQSFSSAGSLANAEAGEANSICLHLDTDQMAEQAAANIANNGATSPVNNTNILLHLFDPVPANATGSCLDIQLIERCTDVLLSLKLAQAGNQKASLTNTLLFPNRTERLYRKRGQFEYEWWKSLQSSLVEYTDIKNAFPQKQEELQGKIIALIYSRAKDKGRKQHPVQFHKQTGLVAPMPPLMKSTPAANRQSANPILALSPKRSSVMPNTPRSSNTTNRSSGSSNSKSGQNRQSSSENGGSARSSITIDQHQPPESTQVLPSAGHIETVIEDEIPPPPEVEPQTQPQAQSQTNNNNAVYIIPDDSTAPTAITKRAERPSLIVVSALQPIKQGSGGRTSRQTSIIQPVSGPSQAGVGLITGLNTSINNPGMMTPHRRSLISASVDPGSSAFIARQQSLKQAHSHSRTGSAVESLPLATLATVIQQQQQQQQQNENLTTMSISPALLALTAQAQAQKAAQSQSQSSTVAGAKVSTSAGAESHTTSDNTNTVSPNSSVFAHAIDYDSDNDNEPEIDSDSDGDHEDYAGNETETEADQNSSESSQKRNSHSQSQSQSQSMIKSQQPTMIQNQPSSDTEAHSSLNSDSESEPIMNNNKRKSKIEPLPTLVDSLDQQQAQQQAAQPQSPAAADLELVAQQKKREQAERDRKALLEWQAQAIAQRQAQLEQQRLREQEQAEREAQLAAQQAQTVSQSQSVWQEDELNEPESELVVEDISTMEPVPISAPVAPQSPSILLQRTEHTVQSLACSDCGASIDPNNFYSHDGLSYCEADYTARFCQCQSCGGLITNSGDYYQLGSGSVFHISCLKCAGCGSALSGSVYEQNGQYYCENDYYQLFGKQCNDCSELIVDNNSIEYADHHWHLAHFRCSVCAIDLAAVELNQAQSSQSSGPLKSEPPFFFAEPTQRLYCLSDYKRTFGASVICHHCKRVCVEADSTNIPIVSLESDAKSAKPKFILMHKECARCRSCDLCAADGKNLIVANTANQFYCRAHFKPPPAQQAFRPPSMSARSSIITTQSTNTSNSSLSVAITGSVNVGRASVIVSPTASAGQSHFQPPIQAQSSNSNNISNNNSERTSPASSISMQPHPHHSGSIIAINTESNEVLGIVKPRSNSNSNSIAVNTGSGYISMPSRRPPPPAAINATHSAVSSGQSASPSAIVSPIDSPNAAAARSAANNPPSNKPPSRPAPKKPDIAPPSRPAPKAPISSSTSSSAQSSEPTTPNKKSSRTVEL